MILYHAQNTNNEKITVLLYYSYYNNPAKILKNVQSCVSPCLEDLFLSMAARELTDQYRNQL